MPPTTTSTDYFKEEHNRDDESEESPECLINFIKSMGDRGFGDIECVDYEGIGVELWSMNIDF